MDELDARVRKLAHKEQTSLPPECNALLSRLEEEIRRGTERKPCRRLGRRIVLLAAAAAVLAAAVPAVELCRVWIGDVTVGHEESSYRVDGEFPQVPLTAFSNQVWAAVEEVQQAFQDYQPTDSWYPGTWKGSVDGSWAACEEFLGFPVENPLEDYEGLTPQTLTAAGYSMQPYGVSLHGNAAGQLEHVALEGNYLCGQMRVNLTVDFYPEGARMEAGTGYVWKGEVTFAEDAAATGSGQPVSLVVPTVQEGDYYEDFFAIDAYFIRNEGVYSLRVVAPGDKECAARETMAELLTLF